MAGKPAEPPHPSEHEHQPGGEPEFERIGPLAVERHVKDDGRALILYWDVRRAGDPPRPS